MGYQMKRGNSAVPFKELGSSPAKQAIGGDAGEVIDHWKKYKAQKDQTSKMPKNFNMSGKDTWVDESKKILDKSKNKTNIFKKSWTNLKSAGKQALKAAKPITKAATTVGKRFLGPVGVALTAYDIATTIPKVVKATDKSLKSEAKKRGEGEATDLFTGPKY